MYIVKGLTRDRVEHGTVRVLLNLGNSRLHQKICEEFCQALSTADAIAGLIHSHRNTRLYRT